MKAVAYYPEAESELDDALATSSDPTGFRHSVDAALNDVASGLMVHAKYPRSRCREIVLVGLPYTLIYDDRLSEILVVAVAHDKRQRGYWKKRLRRP